MSSRAFIKFDRMVGVASHDGTGGWTELLAYGWGPDGQEKRPSGTQLADFRLVKGIDRLTPLLCQAAANGTHIASVVFHFAGAGRKKCSVCKFWDVLISSVDHGSSGIESDTKSETVYFNFSKMEMSS